MDISDNVHILARVGAYNNHCSDFLDQVIVTLNDRGPQEIWIVMDNVAFYKTQRAAQLFEYNGYLPEFLPPYSPILNQIENLFGKLKTCVRTQGFLSTQASLLLAINHAAVAYFTQ